MPTLYIMKNILIAASLLFGVVIVNAQKRTVPKYFSISQENVVVWQKIYETNLGSDSLLKHLEVQFRNTEFTRSLSNEGDNFVGYSGELKAKPINGGNPYNAVTAYVNVELKESRYRVTIKDIKYNAVSSGINVGGLSFSEQKTYGLGEYVIKKGKSEFQKGFMKVNMLRSYDKSFDNIFKLKEDAYNDDW